MGRVSQKWDRSSAAVFVAAMLVGEVSSIPVEAWTIEIV